MKMPKAFGDSVNIAAISDNGVLEELALEKLDNGMIRFVASHFSPYVFYSRMADMQVISVDNETYLSNPTTRAIVNTLHKKVGGTIEAKWFVGIILICLAMILLLMNRKPNRLEK